MELGGFGKNTCLADESLYNLLSTQFGSVDNGGGTLVENGEDICLKDLFWFPGRYQQRG